VDIWLIEPPGFIVSPLAGRWTTLVDLLAGGAVPMREEDGAVQRVRLE